MLRLRFGFPFGPVAAALVLSLSTASFASSLPPHAAPSAFRAIDVSSGGRILQGTLPHANSPAQALRAGVRLGAAYFDDSPQLTGIVQSTDGHVTLAQFRATLAHQAMTGLLVAVTGSGTSRIAFLFDRRDDIAKSIRPMVARLQKESGPSSAGGTVSTLHPMRSPDGSVLAALPDGWKMQQFGNGYFVAAGPDGAEVDQEVPFHLTVPGSPIANTPGYITVDYAPDPAKIFVTALESATRRAGKPVTIHVESAGEIKSDDTGVLNQRVSGMSSGANGDHRFEGAVLLGRPGVGGGYLMEAKMVSAPIATYKRDFPVMAAIFGSYRVDQQREGQITSNYVAAMQQETQHLLEVNRQQMARNQATFYASMQNAHAVQDSIDRSTAGFVRYLGDTDVMQPTSGGAHETLNSDYAHAVVRANPNNFRIVPMSEYHKGVDF